MQIRVERDVLVDAIGWVSRTLPARPTNPVLRNVLFSIDTSSVKPLVITTFDGDSLSDIHIAADIDTPGSVLISGQLLQAVVRMLPNAPVVMDIDDNGVKVTCGRAEFQLPVASASSFPQLPDMPAACGSVPGATLAGAVGQVAVAAGKSLARADLLGIHVEFRGNHIRLVATDRHRLSLREVGWSANTTLDDIQVLVPARAFNDIARALASAESVDLYFDADPKNRRYIGFEANDRRTITQLMGEKFNEYEHIIPQASTTTVRFDSADLMEAAKRVNTIAASRTTMINNMRLDFTESTITLSASGENSSAREVIDCVVSGVGVEYIVFNADYLIDGVNVVNAPITALSMTDSRRIAMLQGAAGMDADVVDNFKHLIAPSRL